MAHTKILSPIPTGGYRVDGEVNWITTSFLLDTGASTTLLRKDTWERVKAPSQTKLTPCLEQRLVSVDGSPLQVHGQAMVEFELAGEIFQLEVTVVSPLTSEAIYLDWISFVSTESLSILETNNVVRGEQRATYPAKGISWPIIGP